VRDIEFHCFPDGLAAEQVLPTRVNAMSLKPVTEVRLFAFQIGEWLLLLA
jgi:hypothetical protein